MTIYANNLHRTFKSIMKIVVLVVLPIVFIKMFIPAYYEVPMKVAFLDEDKTFLTESLQSHLALSFEIVDLDLANVTPALIDSQVDYVVFINPGFTTGFLAGLDVRTEGLGLSQSVAPALVQQSVNNYLGAMSSIAMAADGNQETFKQGMATFQDGYMAINAKSIEGVGKDRSIGTLGFLVQFMLYMSVIATGLILEEKSNKTFYRIFAAPISMRNYMAGHLLSGLTVAMIQISSAFAIFHLAMKVYLGKSPLNMFLLFAVFALVCVAFGLFVTSYCKTAKQAYVTIMLVTTPLVMLGGCYWPRDFMPEILIKIGNLLPTTYVMQAAGKLLDYGTLTSIGGEIIILFGFAAVFFAAGVLRRADIAR